MNGNPTFAVLLLLLTVALTVTSQVLLKQGMLGVGKSPRCLPQLLPFVWRAIANPRVLIGLLCGIAGIPSWVIALSLSDLSFAYPFMGLAIVLVLTLSSAVLHERIPVSRWIGVVAVAAGLWLAALR